jgi:Helicase conserved C-terminal domain
MLESKKGDGVTTESCDKPPAEYAQFDGARVRDRLVEALRFELLGPEAPDEVLNQSPATRYLVGMLAPKNTETDSSEDDQSDTVEDSAGPAESTTPISLSLTPSSIGLSFVVPLDCPGIEVQARWGEYQKVEMKEEVEAQEATDLDRDEDPGMPTKKRKQHQWHRSPHTKSVRIASFNVGREKAESSGNGVEIEWMIRWIGNRAIVSVFLVNDREAPADKRAPDEAWLYQPQLRVSGEGAPFLARSLDFDAHDARPASDPDVASANLVYRHRREFATGHGVAASWQVSAESNDHAEVLWTEIVPQHEVLIVKPAGAGGVDLDMVELGTAPDGAAIASQLQPLLDAYRNWIDGKDTEAAQIEIPHRSVAIDHVEAARILLERMQAGIDLIRGDSKVLQAFCFANNAMALQREASVKVLSARRGVEPPTKVVKTWRPFQMGFILQCLGGIVDPSSEDRRMVDLLWFPTGGGKTEAYLGLTAFTLAYRRLRKDSGDRDSRAGTSVLMRYTLRLLTIQQFQRATALLCACEVIRKSDLEEWGDEPFTIGLWVGGKVTPNSFVEARETLDQLKLNQPVYEASPYQIVFCPWCGTDLDPHCYTSDGDLERTLIHCSNQDCGFNAGSSEGGLPVLLVDDEIYHHPPSLLLATVDKFAQMAWNGRVQSLFGRVTHHCPRHGYISAGENHPKKHAETRGWSKAAVQPVQRMLAPPDLIIQDELHLISGPLGTLVGIYESAVEGLCSVQVNGTRIQPKVIASTATIRRAKAQAKALFNRDVVVFPPQGLDVTDSFFARQDDDAPGRMYVGVYGPGKSIKTSLVRVYAAMLSRAQIEFQADPTPATDAYMTLVGYFNSLRELGGALRLVDDDVPARLRVLEKRCFGPRRFVYETHELTSRMRSRDIVDTLKRLERTFVDKKEKEYPIDIVLASNMLSVGVDIDRLGVMVVSGQPKTTAEYIQATSRVGRVYPGLVVEVYNWVRPRDTSHYEQFIHYHDTFYRHVEATSVTPFSARARDRALPGVLVSYLRLNDPVLATEQDADCLDPTTASVARIVNDIVERAGDISRREDVRKDTETQLKNLLEVWRKAESEWTQMPLVYTGRGLVKQKRDEKTILMRPMEQGSGKGLWTVAGSLREVEAEVDIVLVDEENL